MRETPTSDLISRIAGQLGERHWSGAVRQLLPRTLFGRTLLIIVTPVILAQIIAITVFFDRHWSTISERMAAAVSGEITTIIARMAENPAPDHFARVFRETQAANDLITTFEPGGSFTPGPAPDMPGWARPLGEELDRRPALPWRIAPDDRPKHLHIMIAMDAHPVLPDGVLHVRSPERRLFSSTGYVFLLWMIGSSIILFAVAIIFMRNQIRPIRRLAVAADRFGKGREVRFFKPEGATEVRQAASAFVGMRDRILRQIEQRTAMLSGVSHDLRTPLTRMKLQLEMAGNDEMIADLRRDIAEMEQMIEGYLAFARGEGTESPETTDLGTMLADLVETARRSIENGGQVDLHQEEALILPLRPQAMRRALTNLIGNARRYGGNVWVQAGQRDEAVEIIIDDDGPGIPETERESVFRPFTRLEESRNPQTGGTGLGLTIARDVARSHGGDVILADSPRGGLRAIMRLPV